MSRPFNGNDEIGKDGSTLVNQSPLDTITMDPTLNPAMIAWDDKSRDSSTSMAKSDVNDSKPAESQSGSRDASSDIREHMNIQHFEEIQFTFLNHVNEDGSEGFYLEMFLKVFDKILGGNLSDDQLTTLFNKIDANSDGTVSWDEFSSYMMTVSMEESISVTHSLLIIVALANDSH